MAINFILDEAKAEQLIVKWHGELSELWGHSSMPERFGYVIWKASAVKRDLYIKSFDASNPLINELLEQQWSLVLNRDDDNSGDDDYEDNDSYCICGHIIQHEYFIKNLINGNILRVGSDCIQKLGGRLANAIKAYQAYEVKDEKKFRQCLSCGKFRIGINRSAYRTQCKSCYREKNVLDTTLVNLHHEKGKIIQCTICAQDLLINEDEAWKTKCSKCYKNEMEQQGRILKHCSICRHIFYVSLGENWKTKCLKCHFQRK